VICVEKDKPALTSQSRDPGASQVGWRATQGQRSRVHEEALFLLELISQMDKLIDALIYEIYGLTEEEIEIVEGAQSNKKTELEAR